MSGGLDSRVLLEAMAALRVVLDLPLLAAHVDHGLHPDSGAWAAFCAETCAGLGVPLHTLRMDARAPPGASPEAYARTLRYQALRGVVGAGDVLMIGHHRDDQAETVLLQLLRSAGPHGLAAMPRCTSWEGAWLCRPLLDFPRQALREFAVARGLRWIEDPSNDSARFERNFLRHQVIPILGRRWPAIARTLAQAADRQADAAAVLDTMASEDLQGVRCGGEGALSASAMRALSLPRRRNLLRAWLRAAGLPPPPAGRLRELAGPFLDAARDRQPRVSWSGVEVRRYRDAVHAMPAVVAPHPVHVFPWDLRERLALPCGVLYVEAAVGAGLKQALCRPGTVTVRWRGGGERCRPAGHSHTRPLKRLFQEAGIPPWRRDRLPLVYLGDRLAAVAGLWVCEPFAADPGEPGWALRWAAAEGRQPR
ncbi:MAG: tRNA lysidine(34) synthetase TilS [Gammaproteobacteria bacterium]